MIFVIIFTQMIRRSGSCRPQAIHDLQLRLSACIHGVHNWMKSNRLQLNKLTPTRRSFFGVPQHDVSINSRGLHAGLGPYDIIPSTTVRDLGTALTQSQYAVSCSVVGCFAVLRQLRSIQRAVRSIVCIPDSGCRHCAVKTGLR